MTKTNVDDLTFKTSADADNHLITRHGLQSQDRDPSDKNLIALNKLHAQDERRRRGQDERPLDHPRHHVKPKPKPKEDE